MMSDLWTPPKRLLALVETVCCGELNTEEGAELEALLCDQRACRWYRDFCLLEAELRFITRAGRADNAAHQRIFRNAQIIGSPDTCASNPAAVSVPTISCSPTALPPSTFSSGSFGYFSSDWSVSYLIATVVCGIAALVGSLIYVSRYEQVADNRASRPAEHQPEALPKVESVGRITGMVDCKWANASIDAIKGDYVPLGRKYDISSGLMEITYDTGAKVILQGPVTYRVESRNSSFLSIGKATGKMEVEQAKGFVIRTPTAVITDLGTEFGVEVAREGTTDMHVFTGSVKIVMAGGRHGDAKEQIVHTGGSVRADTGRNRIAAIESNERRFVRGLMQYRAGRVDSYADLVLSMRPAAYYRMERPTEKKDALSVVDSAPSGRHGVLHLADEYGGDPWRDGPFGNSLYLRGGDKPDYVDVQAFPLAPADQMSISAWVYLSYVDWWNKIALQGQSDWQFYFGVYETDGDLMACIRQRNGSQVLIREGASKPLPRAQWQHVAFVADGAIFHLYRNGLEVAAAPYDGICHRASMTEHLGIGYQDEAMASDPPGVTRPKCCFWRGQIDELAVFHHALSAEQIRQLSAPPAAAQYRAYREEGSGQQALMKGVPP
jgi:hypothetical protein